MTRDEKLARLAALSTARFPDYPLVPPFVFRHDRMPNAYTGIIGANAVQHAWQVVDFPGTSVLLDGRGQLAPEGTKAGDRIQVSPPSMHCPNGFPARRFPCFRLDPDEQLDALIAYEEALVRDQEGA